MPMPPYPPAQVTRTATWQLSKGGNESDGTPDGNVDWVNADGNYASPKIFSSGPALVTYKTYMYLNGSGTPSDGSDEPDVPDIVSAAWTWSARLYNNLDPVGPYFLATAPEVHVQIGVSIDSATAVHTGGDPPNTYRPQTFGGGGDIPDFTPFDWKFAIGIGDAGQGDSGLISCENPPAFGGSCALAYQQLTMGGGATWFAWWWVLPSKDSCGRDNPKAPMIYRRTDPSSETGFKWEKYDPDDHTAHPTPVVNEVEPNHGPVAGGNTLRIIGSGFGTEATVTVDGTPATSVNVIDQNTIECVAPAHVAGSATVIVTNFDGVSSSP